MFSFLASLAITLPLLTGCGGDVDKVKTLKFKWESAEKIEEDIKVSFVEFDPKGNVYNVLEGSNIEERVAPCSTFKIPNTLISLHEGVISSESNYKKWDGKEREVEAWNKDQTVDSAFKNSVIWYYQALARDVGEEKMQSHLGKMKYGNEDISGGIDKFWLASSLRISPREQVDFLHELFTEKKYFPKENIDFVRELMYLGDFNGKKVYGKTGSASDPKIGWYVGIIESDGEERYFATLITSENKNAEVSGTRAKELTLKIIEER